MTIEATTAWSSSISAGSAGPFNVPFELYSQADLTIEVVINNIPTTQQLGTDYTFTSWLPDNKGEVANPQITFTGTNIPESGAQIVFLLFPLGTQLTAITNNYAFFPALHEMTFDRLCQMSLMLLQWAGKTVKAPDQEYAGQTNQTLPPIANRKSSYMAQDSNGNLTMIASLTPSTVPVSTYWTNILVLTSQIASLTALGFSTYFQGLINSASLGNLIYNMGISSAVGTFLEASSQTGMLNALGIPGYWQTTFGYTTNATVLTHFGFSTFFQTLIGYTTINQVTSSLQLQDQEFHCSGGQPSGRLQNWVPQASGGDVPWGNNISLLNLDPTGAVTLDGLLAPTAVTSYFSNAETNIPAQRVRIWNASAYTITLKNSSTYNSNLIANAFNCPGGTDFSLTEYSSVDLVYSNYAVLASVGGWIVK